MNVATTSAKIAYLLLLILIELIDECFGSEVPWK